MEKAQTASPNKDNLQVVEGTAKEGSILTGIVVPAVEGTAPLAKGTTLELPHAWMTGLTAEQKADADLVKSLSKFEKGIPDLAKSYAELEKKQSQFISVPNEKTSPEELARYRKAVGVPDKPEDYKLEKVSLPDGLIADPKTEAGYLELAHKLNMSGDQVKAIHAWYYQNLNQEMKVVKTTMEEAEAAGSKEMGVEWPAAKAYANRMVMQLFSPTTVKLFEITGLGNSLDVIRDLSKIGKLISEHPFKESRGEHLGRSAVGQRSDAELAEVLAAPEKPQE